MVRLAVSALFAAGAAFHLIAVAIPIGTPSPPWRHCLFIAINLTMAIGFAQKARWLLPAALVFAAQQGFSHGSDVARAAREGVWDIQGTGALLFLPLVVGYAAHVWRDNRGK